MPDTAKRLCGPVLLTATAVTYYTVPANTTTIVRNIHVSNGSGTAPTLTMGINGTTNALCLWSGFPLPPNGSLDWSGFLVLAAGDTLVALTSGGSTVATVSGVEST